MMRVANIFTIILIFMCSGCATIGVDVDLYKDPARLKSADIASVIVKTEWFDKEKRAELYNTFLEDAKEEVVKKNTEAYLHNNVPEEEAKKWANQDWNEIRVGIDKGWEKVDQYAEKVKSTALKAIETGSVEAYDVLRNVYDSYVNDRPFSNFVHKVSEALRLKKVPIETLTGFTQMSESSRIASGIAASTELESPHVGYPIFDPLISKISRDESAWNNFVHAYYSANLGNAQFVLVREGLVVFHIKSLDFDPTPIIGASAATAKLGLQLASALASGYSSLPINPVKQSGGSTGDTSSLESKSSIVVNEAEMQTNRELLKNHQRAKAELLNALADLYDKVSGKNFDYVKKEFTSNVNFYQGRVATAGKE